MMCAVTSAGECSADEVRCGEECQCPERNNGPAQDSSRFSRLIARRVGEWRPLLEEAELSRGTAAGRLTSRQD